MTALTKETSIDHFVGPTALFPINITKIKEISVNPVKEALGNRLWLHMVMLPGAWRCGDNTLGTRRLPSYNACIVWSPIAFV